MTNVTNNATKTDLERFGEWYKDIFGYVAAIVCSIGIILNVLNMIVLTRKKMRSPTNAILTALAFTDCVKMAIYLPYAIIWYCLNGTNASPERNSTVNLYIKLVYAIAIVPLHTTSSWLTVTLAIFRYVYVRFPIAGTFFCTMSRAKIAIVSIYVSCIVVLTPMYMTFTISESKENPEYMDVSVKLVTPWDKTMFTITIWLLAIVSKSLPCALLLVLTFLLVRTMRETEKKRKSLAIGAKKITSTQDSENHVSVHADRRAKHTNRTTRMLLTVVLLFLITELPNGILSVLSGISPAKFNTLFGALGDVLDTLALINNSINFILYCNMSKLFRVTFQNLFCRRIQEEARRITLLPSVMYSHYQDATNGETKELRLVKKDAVDNRELSEDVAM